MKTLKRLSAAVVLTAAAAAGFVYSGIYDVAADRPHAPFTRWLLQVVMERSVEVRAAELRVPGDLDDPARIRRGAVHYAQMCAGCHLAPGAAGSELRDGMNPRPPKLAATAAQAPPREMFWVIKHGVRMTGMPAWGKTHDDAAIWDLVAFIRQLPVMTPAQYQTLSVNDAHDVHAH